MVDFLNLKYRKNERLVNYTGRFELALGKVETSAKEVDERTKLWVLSNLLPEHMKLTVRMFRLAKPFGKVSELINELKAQHALGLEEDDKKCMAFSAGETKFGSSDARTETDNCKHSHGLNSPQKTWTYFKNHGRGFTFDEKYQFGKSGKHFSKSVSLNRNNYR